MTSTHSPEWQQVREIETVLAHLDKADDHVKCIRIHAWREGSWRQVYIESVEARKCLRAVHDFLSNRWQELYTTATGEP